MRLTRNTLPLTYLVCSIAACDVPSGTTPTSSPAAPAFALVGGTSCDENRAWGMVGPHHPIGDPVWFWPDSSTPLATCGDLTISASAWVEWSWGAENDEHDDFQIFARRRFRGGGSLITELWRGHLEPIPPINPQISTIEKFLVTLSDSVDGVAIVMHYGDTTWTATEEYFTGEPSSVPDRNVYAQVWMRIPPPSALEVVAPDSTSADLTWGNGGATGSHYTVEVWRDGTLDTVLAAATTSVTRSGLTPGQTYGFQLRLVSEPLVTYSDVSALDTPASALTPEEYVTPGNLPPVASSTWACPNDGLSCNFLDASYDPDGTIVEWSWDWGDGTSSTFTTAQSCAFHTYSSGGPYPIVHTVTDNAGATGTRTGFVFPGRRGNGPPPCT